MGLCQSKDTPTADPPGASGCLRIRPLSGESDEEATLCLYCHRAQGSRIARAVQGVPGQLSHPPLSLRASGVQRKLFQANPLLTEVLQGWVVRGVEGWGLGVSGSSSALVTPWPSSPHRENGTEDLPKPPLEVPWRTRG